MKKSIFLVLSLLILSFSLSGQEDKVTPRNSFLALFYNVENLFDTVDDPLTSDEEFTPAGQKVWNIDRYNKKVSDLSEVIADAGGDELPGIVGLCEIENRKVVEDLIATPKLRKGKYEIVHFESPDERGIDVALLVKKDEFTITESKALKVVLAQTPDDLTRDILYAKLRADDGNDYHLFVNHWPSRGPGSAESEPSRISAALVLRKDVDLILNKDNNARIIIMGDFNDEPTNRSVFQILNANTKRKNSSYRELYNMLYDLHNTSDAGTITFMNKWQMFDQIIVSQSLINKNDGYYTRYNDGRVVRAENLMTKDPKTGELVLFRTYGGNNYLGGISDHLPVSVVFRKDRQ